MLEKNVRISEKSERRLLEIAINEAAISKILYKKGEITEFVLNLGFEKYCKDKGFEFSEELRIIKLF